MALADGGASASATGEALATSSPTHPPDRPTQRTCHLSSGSQTHHPTSSRWRNQNHIPMATRHSRRPSSIRTNLSGSRSRDISSSNSTNTIAPHIAPEPARAHPRRPAVLPTHPCWTSPAATRTLRTLAVSSTPSLGHLRSAADGSGGARLSGASCIWVTRLPRL
jgi:hypothetical protein